MRFKKYLLEQEYKKSLSDSALLMLEKDISPDALNELSVILREGILGTAGAIGGAMLGGPLGAVGGGMVGQKVGQKVGNWFKSAQATQITPLFQQAQSSVDNLVKALASIQQQPQGQQPQGQQPQPQQGQSQQPPQQPQPKKPGFFQSIKQGFNQSRKNYNKSESIVNEEGIPLQDLLQQAQQLQTTLTQLEPSITQVDSQLSSQHAQQSGSKGGIRRAVANTGDKIKGWAKKHPTLAKGLATGATVGAAYGLGQLMGSGGGEGGGEGAEAGADGGEAGVNIGPNAAVDGTRSISLGGGQELPIPQGVTDVPSYLNQLNQTRAQMGQAPLPIPQQWNK